MSLTRKQSKMTLMPQINSQVSTPCSASEVLSLDIWSIYPQAKNECKLLA